MDRRCALDFELTAAGRYYDPMVEITARVMVMPIATPDMKQKTL